MKIVIDLDTLKSDIEEHGAFIEFLYSYVKKLKTEEEEKQKEWLAKKASTIKKKATTTSKKKKTTVQPNVEEMFVDTLTGEIVEEVPIIKFVN